MLATASPTHPPSQSNHCGIETSPQLFPPSGLLGHNRTIVGLKLNTSTTSSGDGLWSQSNHCGIETRHTYKIPHSRYLGHNRTIVGLKPFGTTCGLGRRRKGHNRTIVGLKRSSTSLWGLGQPKSQSNHCGIETIFTHLSTPPPIPSQSNHCGIETVAREAP